MSKTRILISGCGGFVMSNFIRYLAYNHGKDYEMIGVDRINESAVLNTIYTNKNLEFYIADITDEHIIDVVFEATRPDIVLHAAAFTSVDESLKDPAAYVLNNVYGTQVLINAAIKWKVKRFIYTDTDESYGALSNDNDPAWTEVSPLNAKNPYSSSKAAGALLVQAAANSFGLDYNITRCSNIYGPRQTANKLIPRVVKSILEDKPIPVYGKGNHIRSWIHTTDVCSAFVKVIEDGKPNEVYNIGTNQEFANIEVVQSICNALGKGHSLITHIQDPRGEGHDYRYAIDASKLKALGWEPKTKFKDGIKSTVDWYQLNKYMLS